MGQTAPGAGTAGTRKKTGAVALNLRTAVTVVALLLMLFAPEVASADRGSGTLNAPMEVRTRDGSSTVILDNGLYTLEYRTSGGSFDVTLPGGEYLLRRCYGRAEYDRGLIPWKVSTLDYWFADYRLEQFSDAIGSGTELTVDYTGLLLKPDLTHSIRVYDGEPFFTATLTLNNTTAARLDITALSPACALGKAGGGLYVGAEPVTHNVLDNGSFRYADMLARITSGAHVNCANWNAAHYCHETGRSLVSGFLSFERSVPTITTRFTSLFALPDPVTGYLPFTFFAATSGCLQGKPIEPGAVLVSERFYADAALDEPVLDRLEDYAARMALFTGSRLWPGEVPVGWNSWGPDAYGKDINEELMLENLAFVVDNLRDWGWNYFQLDDGWQIDTGTWEADDGFSHGMGWMADRIWEAGLIPGLWINPLNVTETSEVYLEHPDWLLDKTFIGSLVIDRDWRQLDGSNPEVQEWLRDTMDRIAHEWGYGYIKIDFSYWTLFCESFYDETLTPEEVFRLAFTSMREGMGDETFMKAIVPAGLCAGIYDGVRISMDNEPIWEVEGGGGSWGEQSIKAIYRTDVRRYYFEGNHRINHPDAIFFRDPLTAWEARTWTTAVGLMGSIVSVGDRLVELTEDAVNVIRTIIPVYLEDTGQPLDLFELEYPELWHLHVPHSSGDWDIVGLFNWGSNRDLVSKTNIPEMTRGKVLDFERLGLDSDADYILYDFWNSELVGVESGAEPIVFEVEPRTVKLLAIHRLRGVPQFISTSRHYTQGAISLVSSTWSPLEKTLAGVQLGVENGRFTTSIYVPPGYSFEGWELEGAVDGEYTLENGLLTIAFTGLETGGEVRWTLDFDLKTIQDLQLAPSS